MGILDSARGGQILTAAFSNEQCVHGFSAFHEYDRDRKNHNCFPFPVGLGFMAGAPLFQYTCPGHTSTMPETPNREASERPPEPWTLNPKAQTLPPPFLPFSRPTMPENPKSKIERSRKFLRAVEAAVPRDPNTP